MPCVRVVSLLSSATETVAALGCDACLVGRSHECDHPESVLSLPVCSRPRIDIHGSSREIDERVKSALAMSLSVYEVDGELLAALQPDVILTQAQCEVCAVGPADVERALCETFPWQPRIVTLEPNSLQDVWTGFRQIADALGVPERGQALVERLQGRLSDLERRTRALASTSVACLEWLDPLMAAGNWMPELVRYAGGRPVGGEAGKHSPWLTWDELLAGDPDVIVAIPCGWGIAKAREELQTLATHPNWSRLRAVQSGRVFVADGNRFFNRPGPRLVETAEMLAEMLHPGEFNFGWRGDGWIRF